MLFNSYEFLLVFLPAAIASYFAISRLSAFAANVFLAAASVAFYAYWKLDFVWILAASIVAKVTRDRLMACLGERYPGYGFERHKGYGRPEHKVAIAELGPTPEHRLSFKPLRFAERRASSRGS